MNGGIAVWLGLVEILASFVLSLAFVVAYAIYGRWYQTSTGRNFMAMMATIALVLGLSIIGNVFAHPDCVATKPDWFSWLRLVVFAFVPITMIWPIRTLFHVMWDSRRDKGAPR